MKRQKGKVTCTFLGKQNQSKKIASCVIPATLGVLKAKL